MNSFRIHAKSFRERHRSSMTENQILIILIIIIALVLFIWEKWRYDFVALSCLFIGVFTGIIPASSAFTGFGHPAVITVAAVLILSKGLAQNGVTDIIVQALEPLTKNFTSYMCGLCFTAMILSAFMNNVGALALLMPVAIATAMKVNKSPSYVLMPLAFSSILGGLCTLIGTPPNIVISSFREKSLGSAFSMFDFTPVGLVVACVGVLFICFVGWRFLPKTRTSKKPLEDLLDIDTYVTEMIVKQDSPIIGVKHSDMLERAKKDDIDILGLIRHNQRYVMVPKNQLYQAGDIIIVEADPNDMSKFIANHGLDILGSDDTNGKLKKSETSTDAEQDLVEAVVGPNSSIAQKYVEDIAFKRRYGIQLLGVSRQGHPYRGRLKTFLLKVGDVLLLKGHGERLTASISNFNLLPLAERHIRLSSHSKLYHAIGIFVGAILLTATGMVSAPVSLSVGALLMVLTKTLDVKEFYESIEWPIIVLLGAMIPISTAFETTGAASLLVQSFLGSNPHLSAVTLLMILLISTMLLTDIMNNAATSIIMAPIAVSLAQSLEVNPDTFLMTVTVGASCSFLTPIGHQNNALVLGPGGYKFSDYWRIGLPRDVLIVVVAIPMILLVWPLS